MRIRILALPVFWIVLSAFSFAQDYAVHRDLMLDAEEVTEDLDVLLTALDALYLEEGFSENPALSDKIAEIKAFGSRSRTYSELLREIAGLFYLQADDGLQWGHPADYFDWRNATPCMAPFQVRFLGDQMYFARDILEFNDLMETGTLVPGTEILQYQGQPASEIIRENLPLVPNNGCEDFAMAWLSRNFDKHWVNFQRVDEKISGVFKGENGEENHYEFRVIKPVEQQEHLQLRWSEDSTWNPLPGRMYYQQEVLVVEIKALATQAWSRAGMNFYSFMDSVRAEMAQKPKKVFLDIRGLGWGEPQAARMLFEAFASKKNPFVKSGIFFNWDERTPSDFPYADRVFHRSTPDTEMTEVLPGPIWLGEKPFKGELAVLTDDESNGLKSLLAWTLTAQPKTTWFGTASVGVSTHYANGHSIIDLPHSGIIIYIPSMAYELPVRTNICLQPDVKIDWMEAGKLLSGYQIQQKALNQFAK